MNKIKNSGLFRITSLILIITFISLDIAYAYPSKHNPGNSTLATPSLLQQQPINEHMARFQQSVFSQGALLASVYDIGEYFFGRPERKIKSLPAKYVEEVVKAGLGKILGDSGIEILNIVPVEYLKETVPEKLSSALSEIGFKGTLPDEGVVFILYKKDGKKFLVQIAEKAKVSASNLPGYEWVISDKYVVKYVPEDYEAPQEEILGLPSFDKLRTGPEPVEGPKDKKSAKEKANKLYTSSERDIINQQGQIIMDFLAAREVYDVKSGLWAPLEDEDDLISAGPFDVTLVMGSNDERVAKDGANIVKRLRENNPNMIVVTSGRWGNHAGDPGVFFDKKGKRIAEAEHFKRIMEDLGVMVDIAEDQSTNTGENIQFSRKRLLEKKIRPKRILIFQTPEAQLRAARSTILQYPTQGQTLASMGVESVENYAPYVPDFSSMTDDLALSKMDAVLAELQCCRTYAGKFMEPVELPTSVIEAEKALLATVAAPKELQEKKAPKVTITEPITEVSVPAVDVKVPHTSSTIKKTFSIRAIISYLTMLVMIFTSLIVRSTIAQVTAPTPAPVATHASGDINSTLDQIQALIIALRSKNYYHSDSAIKALARIGMPAVPALIRELHYGEPYARMHAAKVLGMIDPVAPEVIRALIKALQDEHSFVKNYSFSALNEIRHVPLEVVPDLIEVLKNKSAGYYAAHILTKAGAPAVPALIKALQNKESFVRKYAAEALGKIGPVIPEVVPALIKALGDDHADVREYAAKALGKIGPVIPEVIPALIKTLADEGVLVEYASADALGRFGMPAVLPLIKALQNGQSSAADALGKIGPITPEVIPALIEALDRKIFLGTSDIYAAMALDRIGAPAVPALIRTLQHKNSRVREYAAKALGKIGPVIPEVVPALIKALGDDHAGVRQSAAEALGYIGDKEALNALSAVLNDPAYSVREAAKRAITSIEIKNITAPGSKKSTTLYSVDPFVVIFGAGALGSIFSAIKDFAFVHPVITSGLALIIGIRVAFAVWRILSPMTYYMNGLSPTAIFQSGTKAKAALIEMGEQAVPYLMKSLESEDKYNESIRREVIEILGEIRGAHTVEPLMEALRGRRFSSTFGTIDAVKRAPGEIAEVVEIKKEDKNLAQPEMAQAAKATQLFELVESSLNNERATFIGEGNKLIRSLIATTGTEALAGIGIVDKNMATAKINQRIERTIAAINSLSKEDVTPEARATIESLKKNIRQFEADGAVASLIVLARKAKKEDQKLIIGLETDWIPAINVEGSLQRQAITALMKEIDGIAEALQSMGLDNVEVIRGSGDKLASALLSEADKTHTNLHNIVVMASTSTINSDNFASLRNADESDRPFLAGIDPTELIKLYGEFGEDSSKQLYIRLASLLYLALELAAGKEPPQTPMIVSYDKKLRMVIFLPRAEPMDYEALKNNYKAEKMALQAA